VISWRRAHSGSMARSRARLHRDRAGMRGHWRRRRRSGEFGESLARAGSAVRANGPLPTRPELLAGRVLRHAVRRGVLVVSRERKGRRLAERDVRALGAREKTPWRMLPARPVPGARVRRIDVQRLRCLCKARRYRLRPDLLRRFAGPTRLRTERAVLDRDDQHVRRVFVRREQLLHELRRRRRHEVRGRKLVPRWSVHSAARERQGLHQESELQDRVLCGRRVLLECLQRALP
jgi:hypothetical protein